MAFGLRISPGSRCSECLGSGRPIPDTRTNTLCLDSTRKSGIEILNVFTFKGTRVNHSYEEKITCSVKKCGFSESHFTAEGIS